MIAGSLVHARYDDAPSAATRPGDRTPELVSYPADLTIPTTGMVVTLDRPGRELPVTVGSARPTHVSVTGRADLERVELWDGETVVAAEDLQEGLRNARLRMHWAPGSVGAKVLTARAYDVDGGVAVSNPLWVDVDEAPAVVDGVVDLSDPGSIATQIPSPIDVGQDPDGDPVDLPVQGIRGVTRRLHQVAQQIDVTIEDCVVQVAGGDPKADKTVLTLSPRTAQTAAPIGVISGEETFRFEPGFGTYSLTAAVIDDGMVRYTAPTVFGTDPACEVPAWTGDLDVVGGRLRISGSTAGAAYLYVEVETDRWERVPPSGFVPRTGDHYDFSSHLPPLSDGTALEAWGWGDDGLYLLGTGTHRRPDPLATVDEVNPQFGALSDVVAPPLLRWEYPAWDDRYPPLPAGSDDLFTSGEVIAPAAAQLFQWGVHQFHVDNVGAASHLLVQVSSTPFGGPGDWSVDGFGFRCVIAPVAEVTVDFTTNGCTSQVGIEVPDSAPDVFDQTIGANASGDYDAIVPAEVVTWLESVADAPSESPADPISLGKDITAGDVEYVAPPASSSFHRYVRVVPFFGDQNLGMVSNTVDLRLDTSPPAPEGAPAYRLEMALAEAPIGPDVRFSHCWQSMGWKDEAEKQKLLNEAAFYAAFGDPLVEPPNAVRARSAAFWNDVLLPAFGSGPICAGCYRFGDYKVAFGGAECPSSTDFLSDPFGWTYENLVKWAIDLLEKAYDAAQDVVELVQDGYKSIRDQVTKALQSICTSDDDFCDTVNAVMDYAVDRVLSVADDAVGLLTVPDLDPAAFYAELKRKAITGVVLFAQSLGIPCKEYEEVMATASDVKAGVDDSGVAADDDDYQALGDTFEKIPKSCEEMVEAVWDLVEAEVEKAVDDALDDTAQASGFGLPDFLRFRPHPAGQPGQASVDVTVEPTAFTADREGVTCPATVHSWVETHPWGGARGLSNQVLLHRDGVPNPWRESAYDATTVALPTLPATGPLLNGENTYSEATARVALRSVHLDGVVPFARYVVHPYGTEWAGDPWYLSPYALLFDSGRFTVRVESSCAGWVEQTYQLRSDLSKPKLLDEVRS